MTTVTLNLAWLKQQHEKLAREIGDLRCWCEVESTREHPNYGEMGLRVMKLRHRLVDHLDAEERRGCLGAAVSAKPELQGQVADLLAQHRYFRQALHDLARKLAQGRAIYRELGRRMTNWKLCLQSCKNTSARNRPSWSPPSAGRP
jgi:hypothetical protein